MDDSQVRRARLEVLKVLRKQYNNSESPLTHGFATLHRDDIAQKTSLKESQIEFICSYLEELKHIAIWGDRTQKKWRITANGIVYYEDEISKSRKRLWDFLEKVLYIAIGAALTVAGRYLVPGKP